MALMNWDRSFSIGVRAMDDQHKGLVQALNDLHAAMIKGQTKESTSILLARLTKYTVDHFTAEEALMKRTQYPGLANHHVLHVDLTKQVRQFAERYERGEIALSVHLMDFLRNWLTNHIQKEDRDYGPWLNRCGVV